MRVSIVKMLLIYLFGLNIVLGYFSDFDSTFYWTSWNSQIFLSLQLSS